MVSYYGTFTTVNLKHGLMGHRIVMRKKRNYHKCPVCRCKHIDYCDFRGLFPKRKGESNMTCDKCFDKSIAEASKKWFIGPYAYELVDDM